jgi:hypothetical protein
MKRTELEKLQGKKITGRMKLEKSLDRYGSASGAVPERREQREREKAAGLVAFAVKLPQALVNRLQATAERESVSLGELVTRLLEASLAPPPADDR